MSTTCAALLFLKLFLASFLIIISSSQEDPQVYLYNGGQYCYPSGIPDNVRHADPGTIMKISCSIYNKNHVAMFQWILPDNGTINIKNGQPKTVRVKGFTSTVVYLSLDQINVTLKFTVTSSMNNEVITCSDGHHTTDYCQLKVKNLPGSITHLDANSDSTYESVFLQWEPPINNGGDILNYIISVHPYPSKNDGDKCHCTNKGKCSTSFTSCNVTGLMFGTSYIFTVTANNSVGRSNRVSKDVTVYAKVPPPVSQVHLCMDYISGSTTLNVQWIPCPVIIDDPSLIPPVTNYSVNISGGIGLGRQKSCSVYNKSVHEGTHYNVNVTVNNEVGSSSPALSQTFETTWLTLLSTVIPTHMVYSTAECVTGDGNDYVIFVSSDIMASPPLAIDPTITTTTVPYISNVTSTIPMFRKGFGTVIYKLQVLKTNTPVMSNPIVVVTGGMSSKNVLLSTSQHSTVPIQSYLNETGFLTKMIHVVIIMLILFVSVLVVYYYWIKPHQSRPK